MIKCNAIAEQLYGPFSPCGRYLERNCFAKRVDHNSLRWILNQIDFTGGLARWHLKLCEYNSVIVHRATVKH